MIYKFKLADLEIEMRNSKPNKVPIWQLYIRKGGLSERSTGLGVCTPKVQPAVLLLAGLRANGNQPGTLASPG
jgi:hypothetical protein